MNFPAIEPGNRLGMLGGGQLGRMFARAAIAMGYEVTVLDPDPLSPAGRVASVHLQTAYTDPVSLDTLAQTCAAVSIEFENIPLEAMRALQHRVRLTPSVAAVEIAQDRILEKQFIRRHGLSTAQFCAVDSLAGCAPAFAEIGADCILKTTRLGYDGKGQAVCSRVSDVETAFRKFGQVACVLEEKIDLRGELSVVLARGSAGQVACFPVAENTHVNGILDISVVPARLGEALQVEAQVLAASLANALDYVGVLGVELFVAPGDKVLINEIAPRPHNSGHYTLDATASSQFEQQVRMMCGTPAGDTSLKSPVAMLNLLGDVWAAGEPDWVSLLAGKNAHLHLYGKAEARPGRKMGHINVLADSAQDALDIVKQIKRDLTE